MMHPHSIRMFNLHPTIACAAAALALCTGIAIHAQAKNDASAEPDVLVLANGDTLHGKLVKEVSGKVTFHTDAFGDMTLGWDKIKELHTGQKFAVMNEQQKTPSQETARRLPTGNLQVENQTVILQPENGAAAPPIPVKDAQYIMDAATLDKQVNHEPGFFSGWEGAATAGATIVSATQKQHTFSGAVGLARTGRSLRHPTNDARFWPHRAQGGGLRRRRGGGRDARRCCASVHRGGLPDLSLRHGQPARAPRRPLQARAQDV